MERIKTLLLLASMLVCLEVKSEVFVAEKMTSSPTKYNTIVNAGAYQAIPLGTNTYKVTIDTNNELYKDLSAYIVDQENLISFQQGYRFKGPGYSKAGTPFVIEDSVSSNQNKYLLIDNRYAMLIKKKVTYIVETKFELTEKEQENHKKLFSSLYAALKNNYVFQDFNIYVKPCGMSNAYSDTADGDIHFCSELIDELFKNRNEKAIFSIFFHEVGHTLLNLWGIPGNNNEDIADEFSTYISMSMGPNGYQILDASMQFWQGKNSTAEAINMLQNGDRHSLSSQRLRNIKENMLSGEAFIKRWNKLLYEHHTDDALNEVINKPMPGADVELANKILAQRGAISAKTNQSK